MLDSGRPHFSCPPSPLCSPAARARFLVARTPTLEEKSLDPDRDPDGLLIVCPRAVFCLRLFLFFLFSPPPPRHSLSERSGGDGQLPAGGGGVHEPHNAALLLRCVVGREGGRGGENGAPPDASLVSLTDEDSLHTSTGTALALPPKLSLSYPELSSLTCRRRPHPPPSSPEQILSLTLLLLLLLLLPPLSLPFCRLYLHLQSHRRKIPKRRATTSMRAAGADSDGGACPR